MQINGLQHDGVDLHVGRVEDILTEMTLFDSRWEAPAVIIANPSRRGIAKAARDKLCDVMEQSKNMTKFIYVACDLHSLVRDLKDFTAAGCKIKQIEAFDMFPQTEKLEWLVVLTNK